MEIAALILLLAGGLILPVFGWLIGVVLLWVSNAWNVRDKIIGTLFVPGGLVLPVFLLVFAASSGGGGCVGPISPGLGSPQETVTCTDQGTSGAEYLGIAALIALLVVPIVTTAYLAFRMRRNTGATA